MGTPTILATDKDVGKMWFLILGHDSSALSWLYTSLACLLAFVVICRKVIQYSTFYIEGYIRKCEKLVHNLLEWCKLLPLG